MGLMQYVGILLTGVGFAGLVVSSCATPLTKNLDISGKFTIALFGSILSGAGVLKGLSLLNIL